MENRYIKNGEFVEISYTGYANGEIFDSNIEEDLAKISKDAKPAKTIICVGKEMVVKGLDKNLEGKKIGEFFDVEVSAKEGFGERHKELIKTIPLKDFTEKNVNPRPGMVLALDRYVAKIITVSGARVLVDLNNPLAGKNLQYKVKILRVIEDQKEIAETVFSFILRFVPKFDIVNNEVIVKADDKMEKVIDLYKDSFKELTGMNLKFEKEIVEKK